ncbi:MAG: bifunctional pyr operon transcriptional regulator/uracil phosphoribosyltransferase PyrR [Ilumatobacteraceae bacterium]|jgi:pyrimidine operon attenuation protein/uracil phosphoribosyltransferase|nr:bifunctional pyr operon transcriptional regulator/uracil phosphoribosyltransferase PyrR [Ilumatobacteraceae bacterium]
MATERRAEVLSATDVGRALTRVSHEVVERNSGVSSLVLVGMQRGGVWIAEQIARSISSFEGQFEVPVGSIDVSMYRDDIALRPVIPAAVTDIPVDITGKTVVLVDDVLFTGRTVRAALDALLDHGRPRAVQLAVLVDRGHRELPIRPDFVGKNIPTHVSDEVDASLQGVFVASVALDANKRAAS